jgi:hypothetical protein
MSITKTQSASLSTLADKVTAPFHAAKASLEQIEADARRNRIELAALTGLALTKKNIDRKLEDFKKTHEANRARAKADTAAAIGVSCGDGRAPECQRRWRSRSSR